MSFRTSVDASNYITLAPASPTAAVRSILAPNWLRKARKTLTTVLLLFSCVLGDLPAWVGRLGARLGRRHGRAGQAAAARQVPAAVGSRHARDAQHGHAHARVGAFGHRTGSLGSREKGADRRGLQYDIKSLSKVDDDSADGIESTRDLVLDLIAKEVRLIAWSHFALGICWKLRAWW